MKNLEKLYQECINECSEIGIEYGNIIKVSVNSRAKKRFGQCRRIGGQYEISISKELLDDNLVDRCVKATIFHEIAHTVDGCFNHGDEWLKVIDLINDCYGYDIKRTASREDRGLPNIEDEDMNYKYIFECDGCGQVIKRTKMSKFVKHSEIYTCGRCGGKFIRTK